MESPERDFVAGRHDNAAAFLFDYAFINLAFGRKKTNVDELNFPRSASPRNGRGRFVARASGVRLGDINLAFRRGADDSYFPARYPAYGCRGRYRRRFFGIDKISLLAMAF
jgi:hypothetical protein